MHMHMQMHEFEERRSNVEPILNGFQHHSHLNLCDIIGVENSYYPAPLQNQTQLPNSWERPAQPLPAHCDSSIYTNSAESQEHRLEQKIAKPEAPYSLYFDDALTGAAREEHCRVELLNARQMYGPQSLEVAEKLIRLGDSCEDQSKKAESENYYRQAAGIAQKFDHDPEAAGLLLSLSKRAEAHGKHQESKRWEDHASKTFDNLPSIDF